MTTNTKRAYKLRILVNSFALFCYFFFLNSLSGVLHNGFLYGRSIAAAAVVQPVGGRFGSASLRGSS